MAGRLHVSAVACSGYVSGGLDLCRLDSIYPRWHDIQMDKIVTETDTYPVA